MAFKPLIKYKVRESVKSDEAFIYNSLLLDLYHGNDLLHMIPKDIFMKYYHPYLEELISLSKVLVVCPEEDSSIILAYAILSNDDLVLHWVYTKKRWRKNGFMKMLVQKEPIHVSLMTELGKSLLKKYKNVTYNPFAI